MLVGEDKKTLCMAALPLVREMGALFLDILL